MNKKLEAMFELLFIKGFKSGSLTIIIKKPLSAIQPTKLKCKAQVPDL